MQRWLRNCYKNKVFASGHQNGFFQTAQHARQQKQIEPLTAGLQKVSAQLEASKPAQQVVNNP
jgi:hypothetical protein